MIDLDLQKEHVFPISKSQRRKSSISRVSKVRGENGQFGPQNEQNHRFSRFWKVSSKEKYSKKTVNFMLSKSPRRKCSISISKRQLFLYFQKSAKKVVDFVISQSSRLCAGSIRGQYGLLFCWQQNGPPAAAERLTPTIRENDRKQDANPYGVLTESFANL